MELRPYQSESVGAAQAAFSAQMRRGILRPRIMVQSPTGGGKTVEGIEVAKRCISQGDNRKVVWMTHRIELIEQAHARFATFGLPPDRCEVWSVGKAWNRAKVGYCEAKDDGSEWSVDTAGDDGTWARYLAEQGIDDRSMLIVDEAHHSAARSWRGIINRFPGFVIGYTATPWRLTKYEGFPCWDELVCGPRIGDLIAAGYLSPISQWAVPVVMGVPGGAGGDFKIEATVAESIRAHTNEGAVDWIAEHCNRELAGRFKLIVFVMSVRHAREVTRLLLLRGIRADYIANQSEMPAAHRDTVVDRFRQGELNALVNVNILTEGFDVPDANVVAILRPTKSLALYLQMVGRGTRVAPDKPFLSVLDATTTSHRFGSAVEADGAQVWSLEPRGTKGEGDAPTEACPWWHCAVCEFASVISDEDDAATQCGCAGDFVETPKRIACGYLNHLSSATCDDCGRTLKKACSNCGKLTALGKLREWVGTAKDGYFRGPVGEVCKACQIDHAETFRQAYELENYAKLNMWRKSMSNPDNLTRVRTRNGQQYRLVVMPSNYDGGQTYGYVIFKVETNSRYKMQWNFPSQGAACAACDGIFKHWAVSQATK